MSSLDSRVSSLFVPKRWRSNLAPSSRSVPASSVCPDLLSIKKYLEEKAPHQRQQTNIFKLLNMNMNASRLSMNGTRLLVFVIAPRWSAAVSTIVEHAKREEIRKKFIGIRGWLATKSWET
ncbi:uncharacterized protein Dana_GF27315 [Drosophila ananassae]|uniref:Uncharacterized protein n=1 Tax=Drosophila ananassae TaxID=7217 RepID=A0A0P8XP86_DROAN|nr:uncharacterized protein LOC123257236 [Drosophila ananassae]KPU76463.1 uncharacterized protein Dana_GF27315 [Drosophila ananassae]